MTSSAGTAHSLLTRIKRRLKRGLGLGTADGMSAMKAVAKVAPLSEQQTLNALMLERQSVDLVDARDAYLWVYRNDNLYQRLSEEDKNLQANRLKPKQAELSDSPEHMALRHVLSIDRNAALFDIGCNYGREAIRILRTARASGSSSPLYMFDPGIAGKLAQLNLPLNNVHGFSYYNVAVSDVDGHMLVHMVDGQSQDNKIINRAEAAVSVPVRTVRLDSFIRQEKISAKACFIKCDTQGAELEVLRGFEKSAMYRKSAAIIEFFPNGLATRIKPQLFLEKLYQDFDVYDVGPHRKFFYPLKPDAAEALFARIEKFSPPYTDLLLVGKSLPGREALNNALLSKFGGAE